MGATNPSKWADDHSLITAVVGSSAFTMSRTLKSQFPSLEVASCPLIRSFSASLGTQGVHPSLCTRCCSQPYRDPRLWNVLWCLSDLEIIYCAGGQNAFSLPPWLWAQRSYKTAFSLLCSVKAVDFQPPQDITQWGLFWFGLFFIIPFAARNQVFSNLHRFFSDF